MIEAGVEELRSIDLASTDYEDIVRFIYRAMCLGVPAVNKTRF